MDAGNGSVTITMISYEAQSRFIERLLSQKIDLWLLDRDPSNHFVTSFPRSSVSNYFSFMIVKNRRSKTVT